MEYGEVVSVDDQLVANYDGFVKRNYGRGLTLYPPTVDAQNTDTEYIYRARGTKEPYHVIEIGYVQGQEKWHARSYMDTIYTNASGGFRIGSYYSHFSAMIEAKTWAEKGGFTLGAWEKVLKEKAC